MKRKFFWEIKLRPNVLTPSTPNDHIAQIIPTRHTQHNEDLARSIVSERSELRYDTILSVLNERDAIVRRNLQEGTPVQDSNVLLSPRILGTWTGSDPAYNPSEHKITLGAAPTASMREALREVGVNILGMKHNGGAIIGLVTDVQTGQTDGTFTPGGSLIIQGKKIKIAPAGESGLGIFLVNAAGEDIPLASPLTVNNPQQLIARTPLLPAGQYTLKIITRFAGSDLLNLPRTIIYAYPLRAETPVL